jgi:hypothetical protein
VTIAWISDSSSIDMLLENKIKSFTNRHAV